ncbi:YceI family protein [Streptomyces sp. NPDC005708]|uniref:YceI family protein n=1 Tax=unclassified Streptomyces TaxID=2593676 RepID=UPI0033D6A1EA
MLFSLRRKHRDTTSTALLPTLPQGAGVLSCEVVDPVGLPLHRATVTVTNGATHSMVVTSLTDPYGRFVTMVPPGEYTVLVTADSLEPVRRSATASAGSLRDLGQIQLRPSPIKELPIPGSWVFDPPHTAIRFIAQHVGMAHVHGRFTRFDGDIKIGERMEDSYVEVSIEAASITTGNKTRDSHLCSPDFLDVRSYPYIHFASEAFVHRHGAQWTVQGVLTMHGVSRSVQLDTTYLGMVNGGYEQELRCAALATAELHREDFTLNWRSMLARGIAVVGPRIKLELDLQAMFQGPDTPTPPQ